MIVECDYAIAMCSKHFYFSGHFDGGGHGVPAFSNKCNGDLAISFDSFTILQIANGFGWAIKISPHLTSLCLVNKSEWPKMQ